MINGWTVEITKRLEGGATNNSTREKNGGKKREQTQKKKERERERKRKNENANNDEQRAKPGGTILPRG